VGYWLLGEKIMKEGLLNWQSAGIAVIATALIYAAWQLRQTQTTMSVIDEALDDQKRVLDLLIKYLEICRHFPGSEAIQNPFIADWRPSIGETIFGEDKRQIMAWVKEFGEMIPTLQILTKESSPIIKAYETHSRFARDQCVMDLLMYIAAYRITIMSWLK